MCSSQPLDQDPMAGQTLKVNVTRGNFDSSDLAKERLRFGGLMGGSGRPE